MNLDHDIRVRIFENRNVKCYQKGKAQILKGALIFNVPPNVIISGSIPTRQVYVT